MTLQPMEDYFRDQVRIEARTPDRMRASLTFTSDLQGPPEAAHGGGATFHRMVGGRDAGAVPGEGVEPPENRSAVGHISRSVTPAQCRPSGRR